MESEKVMNEAYPFGKMEGKAANEIALKSVSIAGEVHGLLFNFSICQEYKNESSDTLEIIYTFPVGWDVTMLGMKARIGEKELVGVVVEKSDAEKRYEKAVSAGDSAIMVQKTSKGLYTADLGNIKPGETVSVDIQCARLLNLDQGKARLCIPTVIGERYGDPHCAGGLAKHESAKVDMNASYPVSIEIYLYGSAAQSDIFSPTHSITVEKSSERASVQLVPGAVMDRDFVLSFEIPDSKSSALGMKDGEEYLVAASFAPQFSEDESAPLALKILVDCSGSMHGMSISQAKKGLQRVSLLLREDDYISYSRFGSHVTHPIGHMTQCTPGAVQMLSSAINQTDADMGGTEMANAIKSVVKDIAPKKNLSRVLLLITDGDVWDVKNIISLAKQSNYKIFCIGVGSAPAHSLLRDLAEQTGGVCEFVTPNESMDDAIARMFARMRGASAAEIDIDWHQTPIWRSKTPRQIYNGETIHAFALFNEKPETAPSLSWSIDDETYQAAADAIEEMDIPTLPRVAANRRIEETGSKKTKLTLALKYQLVSDVTSLILVHEREGSDKVEGLPIVQNVPQMPAYGHGNYARGAIRSFASAYDADFGGDYEMPCFLRHCDEGGSSAYFYDEQERGDVGKQLRRLEILSELKELWEQQTLNIRSVVTFLEPALASRRMKSLRVLLEEIVAQTNLTSEQVYALFIVWLLGTDNTLDRHSSRVLNFFTNKITDKERNEINQKLDKWRAAA